NTQTEVLLAVMDRLGMDVGIDIYIMMDLAEDIVAPLIQGTQEITKGSLALGYAGAYSSFLLHAERAGKQYGVDPRDILIELGKLKVVDGQEDMIIDVAANLAKSKEVKA